MAYQPHELSNLGLAGKYLSYLPSDDVSKRYYSGEKYESTIFSRIRLLFTAGSVLGELNKFYPYQPVVNGTYSLYQQKRKRNKLTAITVSAVGILSVFCAAKQNYVLPFFSRFGRFLKTHRLLRQYLWLAFFPIIFGFFYTNYYFRNQIENLWAIHAKRLNNKILSDPAASLYPRELLPLSQVGIWQLPSIHRYDLKAKWANEAHICLAPDYSDFDAWEKQLLTDESEAAGEEGEQGEQAEEASEE